VPTTVHEGGREGRKRRRREGAIIDLTDWTSSVRPTAALLIGLGFYDIAGKGRKGKEREGGKRRG